MPQSLGVCTVGAGMFVRVKTLRAGGRTYRYLHIVENRWENGKTRQHIVGSLGRLDELLAKGDLERVILQMAAHCPTVRVVGATGGRPPSLAPPG